jgi:CHAD domain-containing protein
MESRESGIRESHDVKGLHDYRVTLRRTRALLHSLKGVLPKATIRRFKREFEWIGDTTGPARDIDVYLLSFDELSGYLPKKRQNDLLAFRNFLNQYHQKEQIKVNKLLTSKRYRRVMKDWNKVVTKPVPKKTRLIHADDPVILVANKYIWLAYRKAQKKGKAINSDSAEKSLHDLRKACKSLRYLIEFFQEIYSKKKIHILLDNLKMLQNNLGEFQDLVVQRDLLDEFNSSMSRHSEVENKPGVSMEMLTKKLNSRGLKVRNKYYSRFNQFDSKKNCDLYRRLFKFSTNEIS